MDKAENKTSSIQHGSATFGAGCFWCTEAIFQTLKGVTHVTSGYMGGTKQNPTYEEVCSGNTGHAEVIQVDYDPNIITYEELLLVFFKTHNPTTLNRQGNDVGTQYRSVIFYHTQASTSSIGSVTWEGFYSTSHTHTRIKNRLHCSGCRLADF